MSLDKSFSSEASSRYALALFEVVKESSELDIVETKAKELLNIYKSNKDLENFIKNPTQSFQTQAKVIKDLSNSMGSSIIFDYKVDKELIGGIKLQLGSFMIDTSIKNKLKKYEKAMLEN